MRHHSVLGALVCLTIAASFLVAASVSSASRTSKRDASITLNYWNFTAATIPGETALIQGFETLHPNIHINVMQKPLANYETNLELGARTGQNPDIFQSIPEWLTDLQHYGVVEDLTSSLGSYVNSTFIPAGKKMVTLKGHVYGVPFRIGQSAVFVNPALFKQAGVAIPKHWTWSQFYAIAAQITKNSKGYGFAVPVSSAQSDLGSSWDWLTPFFAEGGTMVKNNKAGFNGSIGVKTLTQYIQPYKNGTSPKQELGWVTNDVVQAFGQGKVAMWFNGPWYITTIQTSFPKLKFDVLPLPTAENGTYGADAGGTEISVSAGTKYPTEAAEFLQYMTSKSVLTKWAQKGQFLPPVQSILSTKPFQTAKLKPYTNYLNKPRVLISGLTPENTALMASLQSAIESAMSGQSSPKAALNKAASFWNAKLANPYGGS
jgi:multiple sugar transport system substrate-binding protein